MNLRVEVGRLVESETEHGKDRRAFGEFIGPRGELASYAFGWCSDADEGLISIGIGVGNEGGGTFHAAVFENDGGIAYALIDEPFEQVPQGGPDLTAAQARAHEDLPFIWAVVDTVMARDGRAEWLRHWLLRTTSITTAPVMAGDEPILLVSHDADDGMWQAIGTSDGTPGNGRLGHLFHLIDADPTIVDVLDLEPGESATRERVGGPWTRDGVGDL
ncbi:hypothetical protein ACFV9G_16310 [Nocardioides sp. NPDC059952]|uniref:hypothetical protein n=1 Tax=Nocardioides sp. NPDC059952 TaxID=3347014 RepID=UPI00366045E1